MNRLKILGLFIGLFFSLQSFGQSNITGGSLTWEFIDSNSEQASYMALSIPSDVGKMRLKLVVYSSDDRAEGGKVCIPTFPTLVLFKNII